MKLIGIAIILIVFGVIADTAVFSGRYWQAFSNTVIQQANKISYEVRRFTRQF